MTGPAPERRHDDEQLQAAYEAFWHQEFDHSSLELIDRISVYVDGVRGEAARCRLRAAALEGAADALLTLADAQHEGAAMYQACVDGEAPT